jgi:hypothetical protein
MWRRIPLERPKVVQPLDSFPAIYGIQSSLPLSPELSTCIYPEPDQSSPILSLKGPLRNKSRWEDNIKIDVTESECGVIDWIIK